MRRVVTGIVLGLVASVAMLAHTGHVTLADQRDFTLVNGSSITFVHLYVSPSTVDDWQEDVLGRDVLTPGDLVDITFSGYGSGDCFFDIRVDGKNGERGYLYDKDLCSLNTVSFSDSTALTSWSGLWRTSYGLMRLTQSGASVTGTYEDAGGRLTGTVTGNVFSGVWSEAPSYTPPDDAGRFVFVLSSDGQSFNGQWRYGGSGAWHADWSGGR